jgi:branched-chain amino acid transport system substrate-binding protein
MRRRGLLRGLAVVVVIGSMAALAACSTGGSSPSGGGGPSKIAALTGADEKCLGGGEKIPVGMGVALTGSGAFYGKVQVDGARLAAEQIKAAGGPDFELNIKDNQSGDAQAGIQGMRTFGEAGYKLGLQSYIGDLGATPPLAAQYKMLTLDGGGGILSTQLGAPYFYGSRVVLPDAVDPVAADYIKATTPKTKTVYYIIASQGSEADKDQYDTFVKIMGDSGIKVVGFDDIPLGTTDFSGPVAKIAAAKPGAIFSQVISDDLAYFLKQLRGSGNQTPVIGNDYTPNVATSAGSAADGYLFVQDYFLWNSTENDWAKYFVQTYKAKYGDEPELYAANYYNDMVTLWNVVQRVCEAKGSVKSSDDILKAFESNPTFPSVYGSGKGKPYGTMTFDLKTHTLAERPIGVFQLRGGQITRVATSGIAGKGFELVK